VSKHPVFRHVIAFLLAFVFPLVAVFVWWGGFREVEITSGTAGPYTYAYMEQRGDYSKLPDLASTVAGHLTMQNIPAGLPITVLYSNPDVVDVGQRLGRTGFLLPPGVRVKYPLLQDSLPARSVVIARIQAGSLLAPSKAYAALDHYQQARGQGIRMPTVELYRAPDTPTQMGVLTVEMPNP